MKKPVIILLHAAYWLLYLFLLSIFYVLMVMGRPGAGISFLYWNIIMLMFAVVPALIGFYLFYTLLFRHFLSRGKIGWLVLAAIVVSVGGAAAGELLMYFSFRGKLNWAGDTIVTMGAIMAINVLLNGLIGMGMRSFIAWYSDLKWKEALSRKNYEMEMALVRSQINPHFLFNTINNIDVLIEKDPAKASGYLNGLSDIMRFMLYETRAAFIPLEKELEYIHKYVDLQRIRTANTDYVRYTVQGDVRDRQIAPMVFIPFIENAFKHAAPARQGTAVNILITVERDYIIFECTNHYQQGTGLRDEFNGLGNELISKRLSLLYGNRHELCTQDSNDVYKVHLAIPLS